MKRAYIFFILLCSFAFNASADNSQFPAPTNLNATNIQFGDATLSWSNDINGMFWIVSYNVSQSNNVVEQMVSTDSLFITDLILGTVYNWKVRMIDIYGDTTAWSTISNFITYSYPNGCNPISQLTINAMGPTGITIQWEADSTQNEWEVVYGELGSDPNLEGARVIVNNYFYEIPNSALILDNWYQIAVKNNCLGNESGWSFISTRYISNQFYDLPVMQTFEDDVQNSTFGFVNGPLNPWLLSDSYNITVDGNKSIYISTNGGNTNDYYSQSSAISYAYIDVLIPSYASSFYLDFKWNCIGELAHDGLKVYLMGENTPLNVNELPSESNSIGNVFYNNSNNEWQSEHIEIPAQFVGQVRRLVFAWKNNASVGGQGGAIVDDIYITARYCAPPTNPTHSYVSSSYANLSWNFAEGQEFFNIQYRKAGHTQWNTINSVTSNHSLQNLDDNTTYIYRVQADCLMEESFFSTIDTFTTRIKCLPPSNIHTISYSSNNAILSWDQDPSVTKWVFEYGINNGENTVYTSRDIYTRFDTLTNLMADTYYSVRIKAISIHEDTSRYSNFILHTLCNTVNQFPFNDLSDSIAWNNRQGYDNQNSCWETKGDTLFSPIFNFTNLGYPELSFMYYHCDSVFPFLHTKLLATNNGSTYFEIKNLIQTENFASSVLEEIPQLANEGYIRFAFVPKHNQTSKVNNYIKDFQIRDLCKSPDQISIMEIGSTNVIIDWTSSTNNTSWNILVTDTLLGSSINYTTSLHPFQISNLLPNTVYNIWIKSNCGAVSDQIWTKITFKTNTAISCQVPTNFNAIYQNSAKGDETVSCSWDDMGETIWELEFKERYAVDWNSIRVFNVAIHNIRNLDLETEYMFRVRSYCGIDEYSDWSTIIYLNLSSLEDDIDYSSLIKISPNPSKDIINIETQSNDFGETKLINQNGQTLNKWDKLPKEIRVSSLPTGTYYLQITSPTNKISKKIIVIK